MDDNNPKLTAEESNVQVRGWLERVRALRAEFEAAGEDGLAYAIEDMEQKLCDCLTDETDEEDAA